MGVPDGWRDCPNVALGLIEGIFLPFKTPLNGANGIFTIDTIFNHAQARNWNIGLWIDLTNTSKYYKPFQVEQQGIQYHKLSAIGGKSPSPQDIRQFNRICSEFLLLNPGKIIGVHCTHGFNRTGYFISAFLNQEKKLDAALALEKFAEQRPPGIYRQRMVNDFIRDFGRLGGPPAPAVSEPSWG